MVFLTDLLDSKFLIHQVCVKVLKDLDYSRHYFPGKGIWAPNLEITPQDGFFSFLNFKGGLFTGNGVNPETDNAKDFIGRLGFQLPFYEANLSIDGGVSGYFGQVRLDNTKLVNGVAVAAKSYTVDSPTSFAVDSTTRYWDRNYIGGDLEIYYDLPILGGFSLRGEYIQGKNPGNQNANLPYRATTGDLYMRNFYGYYLIVCAEHWFIKSISIKI